MNFIVFRTYLTISVICLLLGFMEEAIHVHSWTFTSYTMLFVENEKFEGEQQRYTRKYVKTRIKTNVLEKWTSKIQSVCLLEKRNEKSGFYQNFFSTSFWCGI